MALVQAIVTQSARSGGSTDEIVSAIRSRIQALSDAQDALVHGHDEGVDIDKVLRTALRPHMVSDEKRVTLRGPKASVSAQQGLGLALAVHELATNATKYGSLSSMDGIVLISWRIEGDKFIFEWKEQGGPFVVPPKRTGFGSRLLTRIVPSYFGGKGSLAYNEDGFEYDLAGTLKFVGG